MIDQWSLVEKVGVHYIPSHVHVEGVLFKRSFFLTLHCLQKAYCIFKGTILSFLFIREHLRLIIEFININDY